MERFAARARAVRFEHDPAAPAANVPTLVERAGEALAIAGPATRRHWLDRLTEVSGADVADMVDYVPELSDPTRRFILDLLHINRERLLDEC